MVPGQRRAGEVVKAPGARLAAIALPMRLGVVAPVADHRVTATSGTAHALGPAMLAHQREAFRVVQQPERLTRSHAGMIARAPCMKAAADQPPLSSDQKSRATATRSRRTRPPRTGPAS